MSNGEAVAAFERAFGEYVGARYAIALCNGTATLHTALMALGVQPGDRVAVPPLTMSATTMAVLHAGAIPVFEDVDPQTWLLPIPEDFEAWPRGERSGVAANIPVSLYGLHQPWRTQNTVDDAAQTLRPHGGCAFTSYSLQYSKILALGEGGVLATNDEALAIRARECSSLGYRLRADQPRIDSAILKSPTYARHWSYPSWNYRMNDLTAEEGLLGIEAGTTGFRWVDMELADRQKAAALYREARAGCSWLIPQHVPEGWTHDYWTYAVAADTPERAVQLADAIVRHGGERPYAAWLLTYDEPAFADLAPDAWTCPIAEDLQPRLLQFQTNSLSSATTNADALHRAIREIGG